MYLTLQFDLQFPLIFFLQFYNENKAKLVLNS